MYQTFSFDICGSLISQMPERANGHQCKDNGEKDILKPQSLPAPLPIVHLFELYLKLM